MGFKNGAYATVWEVRPVSDTHTKLKLNTRRKMRDSDEYETDFSGFVECYGMETAAKAAQLHERDKIQLGDCDVTNRYDREAQREYVTFKLFSFEKTGRSTGPVDHGEPDVGDPEPAAQRDRKPLPF